MTGTMATSLERSLSPPTEATLRDNMVLNLQFGVFARTSFLLQGVAQRAESFAPMLPPTSYGFELFSSSEPSVSLLIK